VYVLSPTLSLLLASSETAVAHTTLPITPSCSPWQKPRRPPLATTSGRIRTFVDLYPLVPKELGDHGYGVEIYSGAQLSDLSRSVISKESREEVASRWTLFCSSKSLCVFMTTSVTYVAHGVKGCSLSGSSRAVLKHFTRRVGYEEQGKVNRLSEAAKNGIMTDK
jgi:hypothetical protein